MTAAVVNRDTRESAVLRQISALSFPVAAATTIFAGTLVATDAAGRAVPASATSAIKIWGRAEKQVVNTVAAGYGAAGALSVEVLAGVFMFTNGDSIVAADVGKPCYAGDDQTVYLAAGTAGVARPYAGIIYGLDGSEVKVGVGPIMGAPFDAPGNGAVGVLPAFAAGAMAPAATALADGAVYDVPTTAANSTITLPAASAIGTKLFFCADGTKNGHTVTYVDATGTVSLTTALTASKRHLVVCVKTTATAWVANAYIGP